MVWWAWNVGAPSTYVVHVDTPPEAVCNWYTSWGSPSKMSSWLVKSTLHPPVTCSNHTLLPNAETPPLYAFTFPPTEPSLIVRVSRFHCRIPFHVPGRVSRTVMDTDQESFAPMSGRRPLNCESPEPIGAVDAMKATVEVHVGSGFDPVG